MKELTL